MGVKSRFEVVFISRVRREKAMKIEGFKDSEGKWRAYADLLNGSADIKSFRAGVSIYFS